MSPREGESSFKMREDPVGEIERYLKALMIVGKVELLANNSSQKEKFLGGVIKLLVDC